MQSLKFSTEVKCSDLYSLMSKNYMFSITDYYELQRVWMHNAYIAFKDLDKYFILMTLVSKTFDSYKEYFIKYNWDQFYNQSEYELKKFNIVDIANVLNLSKETARRKLIELQKTGLIKKDKKAVTLQRSAYNIQKPINSIITMSKFMSNLSKLLKKNNRIQAEIKASDFEILIKNNFTQCWNYFLTYQIKWASSLKKKWFPDYETMSILMMLIYNQNLLLRSKYKNSTKNLENFKDDYLNHIYSIKNTTGLNAMTISDLTGIPRPTVIRKLTKLTKLTFATKDTNGLYVLGKSDKVDELNKFRIKNLESIAQMACKFFNAARINL